LQFLTGTLRNYKWGHIIVRAKDHFFRKGEWHSPYFCLTGGRIPFAPTVGMIGRLIKGEKNLKEQVNVGKESRPTAINYDLGFVGRDSFPAICVD
jgi:hypothetical protein